jgi:hypothetical protein
LKHLGPAVDQVRIPVARLDELFPSPFDGRANQSAALQYFPAIFFEFICILIAMVDFVRNRLAGDRGKLLMPFKDGERFAIRPTDDRAAREAKVVLLSGSIRIGDKDSCNISSSNARKQVFFKARTVLKRRKLD